ncbi:MAG: TetR/AcrR family transcriptional regulator [Ignavibacteriae bacterium]|nr:TetR/AcrR family transcriptional regulator [Ignavibacteriota bacterium]
MGIIERKEREKEQRREEIISAAEKVFMEKGLPAATMDEIAELAELSKGTLYLYYKSKEDLYVAVTMRGGEILYKLMAEATSPQKPVLERIKGLGDAYFEFFQKHRQYFRMYRYMDNPQVHKQVSEEMLGACKAKDQRIWNLGVNLMQQAIDEGLIQSRVAPVEAIVMLWAISDAMMRQIDGNSDYWKQLNVDLESTLKRSYEFILEGMMTKKGKHKFQPLKTAEEIAS